MCILLINNHIPLITTSCLQTSLTPHSLLTLTLTLTLILTLTLTLTLTPHPLHPLPAIPPIFQSQECVRMDPYSIPQHRSGSSNRQCRHLISPLQRASNTIRRPNVSHRIRRPAGVFQPRQPGGGKRRLGEACSAVGRHAGRLVYAIFAPGWAVAQGTRRRARGVGCGYANS